ncbi:MAG: CpaF family protein [Anaerolineales bacterium]|nr:CpaF family protein [Anaerolineales bacterium]
MSPASESQIPDLRRMKAYLVNAVSQELEMHPVPAERHRQAISETLERVYVQAKMPADQKLRGRLLREALDELVGYGPIQPLLDEPGISEIMVNSADLVYIEKNGELIETNVRFDGDEHVLRIIDRMLHPLGRSVDMDHPMADARLPDGSRVNAIVPPVAINGPCITIRKFLVNTMTMDEFVRLASITEHMVEFLQACVAARLNTLISGPTSSGKTTLLNILTGYIPGQERIVTIEDAVELQLKQKHVLRLETKARNVDGVGEVTPRDLVRNSLRMRPDRIIIGEVRGGEALDMLQAMNTGHHGSITTLHANSPRDALSRLETMVMMAGLELPLLAIRRQIASAINLIVHMSRLTDGTRKVTHITEVSGMEGEIITMSDIFKFEQTGVAQDGRILGQLKATGLRPMFTPRLEVVGYHLRGEIFGAVPGMTSRP